MPVSFPLENPTFAQRLPYETQGEFGKALTLPCDIQGQPQPKVNWLRNGVPLSETPNLRVSEMSNNSIHINFMRLEDSGMFQCTGENQAGTITGYTWLKVKSKWPSMFGLRDP